MTRIELPRKLAIQLLDQALRSPGQEICGLVAARDGEAQRLIPVRNAANDTRRLFDMDERELIEANKAMRVNGESLFAIYHSHPDSAPNPSAEDLRQAAHPDTLHLIVSLQTKGVLQMRGWYLRDGSAEPVDVGVADNT